MLLEKKKLVARADDGLGHFLRRQLAGGVVGVGGSDKGPISVGRPSE